MIKMQLQLLRGSAFDPEPLVSGAEKPGLSAAVATHAPDAHKPIKTVSSQQLAGE